MSGVWEGFQADFSWILDDFLVVFGMFFWILCVVHRKVGNVVLIQYLLGLRHIDDLENK